MRSSFFTVAALSLLSGALAQTLGFDAMTSPEEQKTYNIGEALPIVWTPGSSTGTITLTLIGGSSANALNPITVIAAGISSQAGSYTWSPIPSTVGSFASYGVNLTSDADPKGTFQYSFAFHIAGGSSASPSPSPSPSASSTPTPSATSTTTPAPTTSTVAPTSTSSVLTSSAVSNSTTVVASTTATTLATLTPSATPAGNATTTGNTPPAQHTTVSGAGRAVSGGVAMVGGVVLALFL